MSRVIAPDSVNQSTIVRIVNSSTGLPETGVTQATAGLAFNYRREGGVVVSIASLSDLSALDDTHADGGLLHVGDGYYRLDVPDAAWAAGAAGVLITGTATGMVVIGAYHPLDALVADPVSLTDGAITAAKIAAEAFSAAKFAADTITAFQSGISTTSALSAVASDVLTVLGFIDTEIAAILTDTDTTIPAQIAALNNLDSAGVQTACNAALVALHLDHLLAATYDPAAKPGAADALLNEVVENDAGISRLTANALEQVFATTLAEITGIADAPATPTLRQAIMLLYMWRRNKYQVTASERRLHNDAGTEVLDAPVSDDATTYTHDKYTDP
jgi:hypothetical protein